jgi:hypothetical protein
LACPTAARRLGRRRDPTHRAGWGRSRSTHARTASMIASTASPSSLSVGVTAPGSGSSVRVHQVAHARRLSARALAARSHPRTVPAGRPRSRAIRRCPLPSTASRSASPITSAPSRRRGTSHDGNKRCVVSSHLAQRARRGVTDRASRRRRTPRERVKPHGDNRPEQPGHASCPAASTASTRSWVTAI